MHPIELTSLESQVEHLMRTIDALQFENNNLRQKIATHIQESARLQHKNQRAAMQVKQIIKHMKEEFA